jgi:hypothetical protein
VPESSCGVANLGRSRLSGGFLCRTRTLHTNQENARARLPQVRPGSNPFRDGVKSCQSACCRARPQHEPKPTVTPSRVAASPGSSVTYLHFPPCHLFFCAIFRLKPAARKLPAGVGSFRIFVWRSFQTMRRFLTGALHQRLSFERSGASLAACRATEAPPRLPCLPKGWIARLGLVDRVQ